MRVSILYDDGRLDVFDDSRFTAAQPFGGNAVLANFELRLDRLGQTGLWLRVHHYDISAGGCILADPEDGTPKASRARGWQFLLAEQREIDHIEQIKADDRELAFRIGGELVDAAKFRQMTDLCVSDASRKSKAQCAVELFETLSRLPGASLADPAAICAQFGFGLAALDAALAVNAAAPRETCEQSSNGGRQCEEEPGWMEGMDDEDAV